MRRDRQRLQDIIEALESVGRMIAGRTEAEFLQEESLRYGVAHRLTVVGEAASRLSPEFRARHRSIPWADIVGLRKVLVHQPKGKRACGAGVNVLWPQLC